jgi:peptidoglycan/LPS O-acetylase OafA/YrhL
MQKIEVTFICLLSWVIFHDFYSTFLKFLIHTPVYVFMNGWDRGVQNNLLTSSLYLVISSFIFSTCIALLLTGIFKTLFRLLDKYNQSEIKNSFVN